MKKQTTNASTHPAGMFARKTAPPFDSWYAEKHLKELQVCYISRSINLQKKIN